MPANNRLALYVQYDKNDVIRDYVFYCLKGLKEVAGDILFIVNGTLSIEDRRKLENFQVEILVRENEGFDFGGWKAGIEYYGYEKIARYDELLITNNTFYGPIYPFSEMWNVMNQKDCDFWGINKHAEMEGSVWIKKNPESAGLRYLQSYWIVFRNKILKDGCFKEYWRNQKLYRSFKEAVGYGECLLTDYFEQRGFKSDTYMNFEKYSKLAASPNALNDIQVIEDRCPIIKRRIFFDRGFRIQPGRICDGGMKLLDYLKTNAYYDVNMIWDDLLSTQHMSAINELINANYILSGAQLPGTSEDKANAALVMYIYYSDLIDEMYHHAQNTPDYIDLYIVTTTESDALAIRNKFKSLPNKVDIRQQPNHGRDKSALFVTCKDIIAKYEYLCFIHSKKSPYFTYAIEGEDFRRHCFMSLLFSREYVANVMDTFVKNPRLGMLVSFPPHHGGCCFLLNDTWRGNQETAKRYLKSFWGLEFDLDPHPMAPLGGMFWIRRESLKTFMSHDWKYDDFPEEPEMERNGQLPHAIERLLPLFVQRDGFYAAFVIPDYYARVYINKLFHTLREVNISGNSATLHAGEFKRWLRRKYWLKYLGYKALCPFTFGKLRAKLERKKTKYEALFRGLELEN